MQPAGRELVDAAQTSGDWSKLDASERGEVPDDLLAALATLPEANAHFAAFPPGVKKALTQWIDSAKRASTRAGRVLEVVALAANDVRANQWPRTLPTEAQLERARDALLDAGIDPNGANAT